MHRTTFFFILKNSHEADIGSYHRGLPLIPGANNLEGSVVTLLLLLVTEAWRGSYFKVFPWTVC